MKTLTQKELIERIEGSWQSELVNKIISEAENQATIIADVIQGKWIYAQYADMRTGEEPRPCVLFCIIKYPTYIISNTMLCQIFDHGNHCLSVGAITYEDDYAYIHWSNLGHI